MADDAAHGNRVFSLYYPDAESDIRQEFDWIWIFLTKNDIFLLFLQLFVILRTFKTVGFMLVYSGGIAVLESAFWLLILYKQGIWQHESLGFKRGKFVNEIYPLFDG